MDLFDEFASGLEKSLEDSLCVACGVLSKPPCRGQIEEQRWDAGSFVWAGLLWNRERHKGMWAQGVGSLGLFREHHTSTWARKQNSSIWAKHMLGAADPLAVSWAKRQWAYENLPGPGINPRLLKAEEQNYEVGPYIKSAGRADGVSSHCQGASQNKVVGQLI
ncbi:hypothetical protein Droror1_Dr00004188 [Drosera rotundifolia]